MNTTRFTPLALILVVGLLAGCARGSAAGIFRSTDGGNTYVASSAFGQEESLSGERILSFARAPARPEVVFAGTAERGVVLSRDSGATWQPTSLTTATAQEVVVHPTVPTLIVVAYGTQVVRSRDEGGQFETLYADPTQVTALAIDPSKPANMWIGTEAGQVIHTSNDGASWSVAGSFPSPISDLLVSPLGSAVVVGTARDGLYISSDAGISFVNRTPTEDTVSNLTNDAEQIVALAQSAQSGSPLLVATSQGLLSSSDLGNTWKFLSDPITGAEIVLSGLYVAPDAQQTVLIVGGSTIARSNDGGASWVSRSIPTDRVLGALATTDAQTVLVGVSAAGAGFVERTIGR